MKSYNNLITMPKAKRRRQNFLQRIGTLVSRLPQLDRVRSFWRKLGPGLITGASDDDPSGIVIYSLAGARGGFGFLWTALLTMPLMVAIQRTCAKIAIVTRRGLAGAMKTIISPRVAYAVAGLMFLANTVNVAANLRAIGDALALLLPFDQAQGKPLPTEFGILIAGFTILLVTVFLSYQRFAEILKVLALTLFAYLATVLFLDLNWFEVLRHTLLPRLPRGHDEFLILAAILGTTISPYLFFWQADEEVEELQLKRQGKNHSATAEAAANKRELKKMRADTLFGMGFSNIVMFAIILTGASLTSHGAPAPETIRDIANALQPLAGNFAYFLFALATIGTGLLAVPVLAGGAAYILSEVFGFPASLNRRVREAKWFYLSLSGSILLGMLLALFPIGTLELLLATGIIYAFLTPLLIALILILANNKKLMGKYQNSLIENFLGGLTLVLMTLVAILSFI